LRHIAFERGVNFRDFGGYDAADGRRVRWRKLFRCGQLSRLSDADLTTIEELGIDLVCDFRSAAERVREPSRLPERLGARVRELDILPGASFGAREEVVALLSGMRSGADLTAASHVIYRQIAIDFAASYRSMFAHLMAAKGAPVLIHCTGGKDRTGIGAALILHVLRVPEETIVADYMLTAENDRMQVYIDTLIEHAAKHVALPASRAELRKQLMPIFGVAPDWLHAGFAAMRDHAGSLDAYLAKVLNVTAADQAKLREWYLEAPAKSGSE